MKRLFLIESDTSLYALSAYELKEVAENTYVKVDPDGEDFAFDSDRGKFFGKVNAALLTRANWREAAPIKLEAPSESDKPCN